MAKDTGEALEWIAAEAPLWRWSGGNNGGNSGGSWHFVTIAPPDNEAASAALHARRIEQRMLGAGRGFGSVRVTVAIGDTRFATSAFPDKASGGWLIPVKAAVRRAEGLEADDRVALRIGV